MKKLTHITCENKPVMIDVSAKPDSLRTAQASGVIKLNNETLKLISQNKIKKGNVLAIAELAGIQAAKKTWDIIPLCHPLMLTKIEVKAEIISNGIKVIAVVSCIGPTGVEMEAMTGVSGALLTIYDMCKAVDKNMSIEKIKLLKKDKISIVRG